MKEILFPTLSQDTTTAPTPPGGWPQGFSGRHRAITTFTYYHARDLGASHTAAMTSALKLAYQLLYPDLNYSDGNIIRPNIVVKNSPALKPSPATVGQPPSTS